MWRVVLAAALCVMGPLSPVLAQQAPAGEDIALFTPVEVDATGHGINRDAAIANALETALAQETGVSVGRISVSVTGDARTGATESVTTTGASQKPPHWFSHPDTSPHTVTTDTQKQAHLEGQENITVSGVAGQITRYQVLSVVPAPGGGFDAKVHAVLALARREGGAGESRRRMAVGDFTGDSAVLRDRLVMDLTQTRRFAVMDRAHDDAYDQEMAVITQQGASSEQARASQALGADYVLTGGLHVVAAKTTGHAAVETPHVIGLTGEVVVNHTPSTLRRIPGRIQADFELIEIATRQIVLADHLTVTGGDTDAVAAHITGEIIDVLYPPRLIAAADPAALIINQGGDGIHIGQRFRMMHMGQALIDPYTHESLGRTEQEAGVIEVTDVQPKISYAKLIAGQVPDNVADVVLRPVLTAPAPVLAAHPPGGKRHRSARSSPEDTGPESGGGGFRFGFERAPEH